MSFIEDVVSHRKDRMTGGLKKAFLISVLTFFLSPAMAVNTIDSENQALFYKAIDDNQTAKSPSGAISYADKVDALSQVLLGAEYVGGSVGEGESGVYDKDPLIRFDVFDCTTYVETILAGAMSAASDEFKENLMRLRYKEGNVSFVSRNHFPSLDWLPNNEDKLGDITSSVVGGTVSMANTIIDKTAWYQHIGDDVIHCDAASSNECLTLLTRLQAEGNVFVPEPAFLSYIPLTDLFLGEAKGTNQALLDRIPSGSVINMVRPDWPLKQWIGTNMNVSHQGIAIRKNGTLFLRHASVVHKKVIDENFSDYFSNFSSTSSLKGFNVQTLRY